MPAGSPSATRADLRALRRSLIKLISDEEVRLREIDAAQVNPQTCRRPEAHDQRRTCSL